MNEQHIEAVCDDCGGRNVVWFAPNDLWNKIVRQKDKADPMLCPRCFALRAEDTGLDVVWALTPNGGELSGLLSGAARLELRKKA